MDIVDLLANNWKTVLLSILGFVLFLVILKIWKEEIDKKKRKNKHFLICPIRGFLRAKKYDVGGNYTEEYQRIRLIKYLLKKGYEKNQFLIEYAIRIGHKGHNILRVDLAIKKEGRFFLVAEIKKNYTLENMRSAVRHQLIPALRIVNAKYGIYFDGTRKSCLLTKNSNGTFSITKFP